MRMVHLRSIGAHIEDYGLVGQVPHKGEWWGPAPEVGVFYIMDVFWNVSAEVWLVTLKLATEEEVKKLRR